MIVANGQKIITQIMYPQGIKFKEDVRILQLGGYDMILRGDWMRK